MSAPATRLGVAPARVAVVAPGDDWDAYVERHPEATGYHLAAWSRVIPEVFGHEPRYLAATRDDALVGVLPLFFVKSRLFGRWLASLPRLSYGGVLASDTDAGEALLEAAVGEARRLSAAYVELRHSRRTFQGLHARTHKVSMRLELLRSADLQWQRLDRKVRNQVRKADKCGVTMQWGGVELVDGFYDVFSRNMRDLGTPVFPKRLFTEVLHVFSARAAVVLASHERRNVAGGIVFRHPNTLEAPWASSLRSARSLCANMRLYWEMLRYAIERHVDEFDFGRSTAYDSTYEFKRQWGAVAQPLVWEYWAPPGGRGPQVDRADARLAPLVQMWRHLPLGVSRWLGPRVVRHTP